MGWHMRPKYGPCRRCFLKNVCIPYTFMRSSNLLFGNIFEIVVTFCTYSNLSRVSNGFICERYRYINYEPS